MFVFIRIWVKTLFKEIALPMIYILTNMGDSAVTGALTLALAFYLLSVEQKRAAVALGAAYALAAFSIALAKILLYSRCQTVGILFDLRSPSGHSALSLVAYGMFASFVASSWAGWRRFIPYLFAAPLVAGIAFSRVALGYHSKSDVVVGILIGFASCFAAWRLVMRGRGVRCRWMPFTIIAVIVVALLCGFHFPAETIIEYFSHVIRNTLRVC